MASDKNPDDNKEDQGKNTVSFKFTKKKTTLKLLNKTKGYGGNDEDSSEKDFIHSAEGKRLKSIKPKDEPKELVIPCLPRNELLFPQVKTDNGANSLDREAAQEIIKDLSKVDNAKDENESGYTIPLLATTHLATEDETNNITKETVSLPEESSLDDYDSVPVSQFGAALLRGMGWKKGEAIGGVNKGLTVPIEYIPRSQGLGLGAERKHEENTKKRRRKPGDEKLNKHSGPIVEKDGKVRHFKSLDETVADKPSPLVSTFAPGGYVVVESGPHRDLSGKITSLDEDNARVYVRLAINSQEVTLSQHNVRIVDREEYKQYAKGTSSEHDEKSHRKTKRRLDREENENEYSPKKYKSKHEHDRKEKKHTKEIIRESKTSKNCGKEPCWMAPLIKVRVISKSFGKGKYYHKKVTIQDVISRTTCTCKTDEGRLLEDVPQSALETVIPKGDSRFVLFVQGKYKGLVGEVVETESSKQQAICQILRDKNVTKCHYDDISEYVGDIHKE